MLTPQWLDELRARVTLSSVIMRTTKLQRAGREWKACCPFHEEKTPSFTVNDEKGFYHCFGCGAHGDVIRWMTDQRGLAFMDAVRELAAEASLELPAPDPRAAARAQERAGLHEVMAAAQDWFRTCLAEPNGARARAYLQSRGFDAHTIERFGFGYAPEGRQSLGQALARFGEPMLIEGGLRIAVDDRDPYDRFRDRLMVPIHDPRGRVIGFAGRILDKDKKDAPKYLNSPDTPLFDKGRTLFNLHRAAPASRQSGRIVVVEGQMDVVALAAAGIADSVAPMGTALTETQIELLWRLTEKPVLCFDGDAAGRRASMRGALRALPLLRPGHSLQFAHLPVGLDPDDLLRTQGREALDGLLDHPASLLDTVWEYERDARPLVSPEDKAGLKERLIAHVDAIAHPDIKALYRRELLDRFSAFAFPRREAPAREVRAVRGSGKSGRRFGGPPVREGASEGLRRQATADKRDALAHAVLAGLARYPDQIERHAEALLSLVPEAPQLSPAVDGLLEWADTLDGSRDAPISAPGSQAPLPDNTRFSFLVEGTDPQAAREDLAEAVSLLVERPAIEAAIAAATARFEADPEGAFAEQQRLRQRKLEIESRLGHMARKRAASAALKDQTTAADKVCAGEQETD